MATKCRLESCELLTSPKSAKGLCRAHYCRLLKHGDVKEHVLVATGHFGQKNASGERSEAFKLANSIRNMGNTYRRGKRYAFKNRQRKRDRHTGLAEYRKWRLAVFERDNYTCRVCNQYGAEIHADHIVTWAESEELRYDVSNGRTVCIPCHYYITFKKKMNIGVTWCGYTMKQKEQKNGV